jgi:hypothetical protein
MRGVIFFLVIDHVMVQTSSTQLSTQVYTMYFSGLVLVRLYVQVPHFLKYVPIHDLRMIAGLPASYTDSTALQFVLNSTRMITASHCAEKLGYSLVSLFQTPVVLSIYTNGSKLDLDTYDTMEKL